jgi:hypothetical protein
MRVVLVYDEQPNRCASLAPTIALDAILNEPLENLDY